MLKLSITYVCCMNGSELKAKTATTNEIKNEIFSLVT